MNDWSVLLPILAALIHGTGFVLYNVQTKLGKSEPNPVSWFLWAFLATLNALSFSAMSDPVAALQFLTGSIGCILTFLYVLFIGKLRWPKGGEWVMFTIGLGAIAAWKLSGPTFANMILVLGVVWSFVPTAVGVWRDPRRERSTAWWFWTVASALTALFIFAFKGGWTAAMVMPITLTVTHGIVPLLSTENRKRWWIHEREWDLRFVNREIDHLNQWIRENGEDRRSKQDEFKDAETLLKLRLEQAEYLRQQLGLP
ncbi:MAG: hypothetical protein AMXMBFR44_5520 [Candidatus Campbellbacteria bacterium]